MICKFTVLNVADNSGVKIAKCIHVFGGMRQAFCKVGGIIRVSAQSVTPNGKYKKGHKFIAVVVRTRSEVYRKMDGSRLSFSDNAVVLLNDKYEMIGTRVMGPVCRELRANPVFSKILSLAAEVV